MSRGDDMRIYWGDARFVLPARDPRVEKILALLVASDDRGVKRAEAKGPPRCRDCDDTGLRRVSTGGFSLTVRAVCSCKTGDRLAHALAILAEEG